MKRLVGIIFILVVGAHNLVYSTESGYIPSASIVSVLAMVASEQQIADQSLSAWVEQNNARSLDLLNATIPRLSVEYGKIMFELSRCSGYLGGELVN